MKRFLVLFFTFFVGLASWAKTPDVLVLPLFMTDLQNVNQYGFETVSEVVASELISNFSRSGRIQVKNFEFVYSDYAGEMGIKQVADKFCKSGLIDFELLASVTKKSSMQYSLLVLGYVQDKNNVILDSWDVLKLASDFQIDFGYDLFVKVLLVDNSDAVVVWQKTYQTALGSKNSPFIAKDYSQAYEHYQKIVSYSKNIVAKDVEHNLMLKFYPKQIDFSKNINSSVNAKEGIGLKYYKKNVPLTKITQPTETMEERLLKEDSFSL